MPFQRLRRALLTAACASLLAACGGSSEVESELVPTRFVSFGDAFADVGQRGSNYTINDRTTNNWTQELAGRYARPMAVTASGGWSYATGSARVTVKPDAAGNAATPTITEQVSSFLASQTIGANDVVIVSGGISDIVAEVAALNAGRQTQAQATANIRQAARDLGAQVRRVVQAGGKHVVVVGTYNLGRSPWAITTAQVPLLTELSGRFNDELLVSIVDLGSNVLYVDAALYFNLVTSAPAAYGLRDATSIACTSADPGQGIGTGTGQVNSALCTPSTLLPGIDPAAYLFADRLYFTPVGNRLFGDYAFDRMKERW
ncbi:MAG TPA: SGNH/GDSL hydrolase family protein [Ramlibacter sp.]|nr:SGNH/GDSL hydrolase family protein [Ramlibacter sp.]